MSEWKHPRLTPAQEKALAALPVEVGSYGAPSRPTLAALIRLGFARVRDWSSVGRDTLDAESDVIRTSAGDEWLECRRVPQWEAAMIELYACAQCGRHFGSESAIREHQDVFAILHRFDPEIEEHDGNPWGVLRVAAGASYGHGSRYFAVEKIEAGHDDTWIVGKRLGRTSRLCPHGLASLLSGDRDISATGHHRARAFAAAIVLGLDARIDYPADPEWSLEEHLHNREMVYSAQPDPTRMAAEFCMLQASIAVFAAQQARLDR